MTSFTKDELLILCKQICSQQTPENGLQQLKRITVLVKENSDHDLMKNYPWLLDSLLNAFTTENSKRLSKEILHEIDEIAKHGPPDIVLCVIVPKITKACDSVLLNHCVKILESFLERGRLSELMWNECRTVESRQILHNDLLVLIVSLPDRMANKLRHENRDLFRYENYVSRVAEAVVDNCRKVRHDLMKNKSMNVLFMGQIVGKLCQSGHGKLFWTTVLKLVQAQLRHDFVLSRVLEKVLSHVPASSVESVLVPLFTVSPCYGVIYRLLGTSVENDSRIKFLLTNKLLLHRHYPDTRILHNILGYLSKFGPVLTETMKNLIQVWAGAGYVKHTSYEQQLYICGSIVISLAFLKENLNLSKSLLEDKVLQGVPNYLESGVERVRVLGMVMAEIITKFVAASGEPLKFEYPESEDSRCLKSLLVVPEEFCGLEESVKLTETKSFDDAQSSDVNGSESVEENVVENLERLELDSDDDLEPYDLTEDKVKSKVKEPRYIRQCMEGLLVKEDPDTFEISFQNAARIIRENPDQAKELAEEFVMILLHTEDQYETENFNTIYKDLMVALVCADPARVAEKLCGEFYARNYNIRQRLDILDTIAQAAQQISKLNPVQNTTKSQPVVPIQEVTSSNQDGDVGNWREIVNRRIEAKTRRFASKYVEIPSMENKFGPVAGHFFFPLLYPVSCDTTVDIKGRDSVLLVRLLYTLAVVVHAALNTPIAVKMSRELLNFTWLFRAHSEVAVRRAVLFAITMVFLSVPSFALVTELQETVAECKFWLEHILEHDEDGICREMAKQGLLVLVDALKNK